MELVGPGPEYLSAYVHAMKKGWSPDNLPYIELTTDADNLPSQRVIGANGGTFVERFKKPVQHGGAESLGFRITLTAERE